MSWRVSGFSTKARALFIQCDFNLSAADVDLVYAEQIRTVRPCRTAVVNTPGDGFLSVRSEPSTQQGERLAKIPNGTELALDDYVRPSATQRRCRVVSQGQEGWVGRQRHPGCRRRERKGFRSREAVAGDSTLSRQGRRFVMRLDCLGLHQGEQRGAAPRVGFPEQFQQLPLCTRQRIAVVQTEQIDG